MTQFIFELIEKMILAFEWDLREIDGVIYFIQYKFEQFHHIYKENNRKYNKIN